MAVVTPWTGTAANSRVMYMDSNQIGYDEFGKVTADRALTGAEWAKIQGEKLKDGLFYNNSNYFKVEPYGSLKVIVRAGAFQLKARQGYIIEDVVLDIDPGGSTSRTDRIVLRIDLTPVVNGVYIDVKKGSTALINNADIKELGLADITIGANTGVITASNIKDLRLDASACGLVDYIYKLDTTKYFTQFDGILADLRAQMTAQQTDFNTAQTSRANAFNTQLNQQKNDWNTWFARLNLDFQIVATFDFDNIAALPLTEKNTTFPIGKMLEVITISGTTTKVAQRELTFSTMVTKETVYNTSGGVARTATITKTFPSGGIKEVVTT